MDPDAIRSRFEENRRKFREEQVERAWKQMSGGAASIPVADFGAVCFRVDSSMDAASVQAAVSEIDTDGDGAIDMREFRLWYMDHLAAQDADARRRREAGYGDEDEWDEVEMQQRLHKHMESMEAARLKRTFDAIDEDGSGEIERNEFHRLVRRLAPERSVEWINNQFNLADDSSGSLDFEEFKAWWNSPEIKEMRGEDQREARERAKLQKLQEAVAEKQAVRAQRREQFEEEAGAATKLQRVMRGRQGRAKARQARIEWDNRQNIAVTKLQCAVRGRIARRQRTFAAIAIAARAEIQAKEDVSRLFWGDGDSAAEREAQLRRDFQRLQASASAAVQQYTWEEWRWRWLEMRSGGWLERLEPSIQAEHCRRLATAAVLAEQEAQQQERRDLEARKAIREKLKSPPPPVRAPSIPTPERRLMRGATQAEAAFSDDAESSSSPEAGAAVVTTPVHPFVPATGIERPGVRLRPVPGGAALVDKTPQTQDTVSPQQFALVNRGDDSPEPPIERPEWYQSTRSPQLLEEHRSMLEESTLHASRMKRRAKDLMQGMKLYPTSSAGCFLLADRAESALAMLQAADEPTAPPGSTLRLTGAHRVPFGELPPRTLLPDKTHSSKHGAILSPINSCLDASGTPHRERERRGHRAASGEHDETASTGDSEYERLFGIKPWSEHSGSVDSGSERGTLLNSRVEGQTQRLSLSPRPVTANSFLREETPKRLQDGPRWTRAADFIVNETVARSLEHSLSATKTTATKVTRNPVQRVHRDAARLLEAENNGQPESSSGPPSRHQERRRPRTVGERSGSRSGRDTAVAALEPRPNTVGGWMRTPTAVKNNNGPPVQHTAASSGTGNVMPNRKRRKQRPIRGLTKWQHGYSKGVSAVLGGGRSVLYDESF